ncbi:MAG: hypothetical protein ABJN62_18675 [Halioglobus sp.]
MTDSRRHPNRMRSNEFHMTLDEVSLALAKEGEVSPVTGLPLSRERIRQIEDRALKKLTAIVQRRGLTLTDFLGPPDYDRPDCQIEQKEAISPSDSRKKPL